MSLVVWIPVFAALVAVVGGALAYWNQKRLDRNAELIKWKRNLYIGFMKSFVEMDTADNKTDAVDSRRKYNAFRMELAVLAPDSVLLIANNFTEYAIKTSGGRELRDMAKFKSLLAEVLDAMRKDVFDKTKLTLDDLKKSLPIQD